MPKPKTKLTFDDPYLPTAMSFEDGKKTFTLWEDKEQMIVQVIQDGQCTFQMRLPLYVRVAIAQMMKGKLNGGELLE